MQIFIENLKKHFIITSYSSTILALFINIDLFPSITYVDASATGFNDSSYWHNAYTDLQTGINNAYDTIWVAKGTYVHSDVAGCSTHLYIFHWMKM